MKTEAIKNMYRHDFPSFVRFSQQILNPHAEYADNWHMRALEEALTKVSRGSISRLVINMPPRMDTASCVSVGLPAWMLGRYPLLRIICLSDGKASAQERHESCAALMGSRRYRALFDHMRMETGADRILTGHGGYRLGLSVASGITGAGGDVIILESPIDALRAQDDAERKRLNDLFDRNILQRLDNRKIGAIILITPRVHEHDLTAHLLAKGGEWVHLNMPAIAFAEETWELPHGGLHRRMKGEALCEAIEPRERLLEILREVGGHAFSYQYLQGLRRPQFGTEGEGCVLVTPYRKGAFYDGRKTPGNTGGAFFRLREEDLILPRVFGIGDDPLPPDRRSHMSQEEWVHAYGSLKFDPQTGQHFIAETR